MKYLENPNGVEPQGQTRKSQFVVPISFRNGCLMSVENRDALQIGKGTLALQIFSIRGKETNLRFSECNNFAI